MRTITYNLNIADGSYYDDIKDVADILLDASHPQLEKYINEYINFISVNKLEKLRSYEEYLFDMLSFGAYLKIYSSASRKSFYPAIYLSIKLYRLRQNNKALKKYVDPVRGVLSTLFLYDKNPHKASDKDFKIINKLIDWLEATGEFREEVKRYRIFADYINSIGGEARKNLLTEIKRIIWFFDEERVKILAKYTQNVNTFLEQEHSFYKWREDYIFCGRKESEYHLSMVGAELMNRAFKNSFSNSKSVTLLVPSCMRLYNDYRCKAVKKDFDLQCARCNKNCNINKLMSKGESDGFDVSIIPHSSDFTAWLKTWAAGRNKGVIGVACPLNLVTGGLELKSLDIPAQCLLTDYCGCVNHWDEKGFPTRLNIEELDKMIYSWKINHVFDKSELQGAGRIEFYSKE
jgi:uncharacterized protein